MKLNYRRTCLLGMAFLSICAFWQLYDNVVPLILTETFGLNKTITGVVMSLDNILALFLIPLFGMLSDRTETKWGKRTPYILAGTAVAVCSMLVLPYADRFHNLPLFIGMLLVTLVAMGSYRSPAVALMPDLTPRKLRSKGNAIINLMGAAGAIYTLVLTMLLINKSNRPDYVPIFISVSILMVVAIIILVLTIKEKEHGIDEECEMENIPNQQMETEENIKGVKKSLFFLLMSVFLWFMAYNGVTTAFSRYASHVWGMEGGKYALALLVGTVCALISYIPIGWLSSVFGRKKTILFGVAMMIVSYGSLFLFDEYNGLINLIFALSGVGWAAINVNSYPMAVDMGKNSEAGKYTGYYYSFSMGAQIVTPVLSGFFFDLFTYRILFPYATVFVLLALLTMKQVKHGDVLSSKKKSVLDNFDVDD